MKNQPDNDDDDNIQPVTIIKDANDDDDDDDDESNLSSNKEFNFSSGGVDDCNVSSNSFETSVVHQQQQSSTPTKRNSTLKTSSLDENSNRNLMKNKRQNFDEKLSIIDSEMFSTHQRILGRNLNGTSKSMGRKFFFLKVSFTAMFFVLSAER